MGEVAVLAALYHREKTGKGQFIEMSQTENIMRVLGWVWPYQQMTGKGAEPAGNRDLCICPADTFLCSDGQFAAIAAPAPAEFKGLCEAMGKPELASDPRFKEHTERLKDENALAILKIVADWARSKKADEIEALGKSTVSPRPASIPQRTWRRMSTAPSGSSEKMIDDPIYGLYSDHEFPVMMSKSPPKNKWTVRPVGFDNEYIMMKLLGRSQAQIDELYRIGVLGKWKDQQGRRPPGDWDKSSGMIIRR